MSSSRVIGFCGSIGCGKTLRSTHLAAVTEATCLSDALRTAFARGAVPPRQRIDCDRLGHEAYAPGTPTYHAVVRRFGTGVVAAAPAANTSPSTPPSLGAPIDRRKLGAKVFADPSALQDLNGIVWPAIEGAVKRQLAEFEGATGGKGVTLLEGALLVEMPGVARLCRSGAIWMYHAAPEVALQRILRRDGLDANAAKARIAAQASVESRLEALRATLGADAPPTQVFDTSTQTVEDGRRVAEEAFCRFIHSA